MRIWILGLLIAGCGGDDTQRAATPTTTDDHASAHEESAPPTAPAEGWLGALESLRFGMRPGLTGASRASAIAEVEAAIRGAEGSLDCDELAWPSDEDGVEDGRCDGTMPVEGHEAHVHVTFRRFAIPGEDGTAGLLDVVIGGPALGDDAAIEAWLAALRPLLEARHGPGQSGAADVRWRTGDRHLQLHDPRNAPCGGLCTAYLWVGGLEHPGLAPRGF